MSAYAAKLNALCAQREARIQDGTAQYHIAMAAADAARIHLAEMRAQALGSEEGRRSVTDAVGVFVGRSIGGLV